MLYVMNIKCKHTLEAKMDSLSKNKKKLFSQQFAGIYIFESGCLSRIKHPVIPGILPLKRA